MLCLRGVRISKIRVPLSTAFFKTESVLASKAEFKECDVLKSNPPSIFSLSPETASQHFEPTLQIHTSFVYFTRWIWWILQEGNKFMPIELKNFERKVKVGVRRSIALQLVFGMKLCTK